MKRLHNAGRVLRTALLGTFVALLLTILAIQVEQHVLRRRAEQLLRDIRALPLRQATFNDVQQLQRRWGRPAHYEANCSEGSCRLTISFSDFLLRHAETFIYRLRLLHLFMQVGGRPVQINAEVALHKGVAWGKGFHVLLGVPAYRAPESLWPDYTLMGNAQSVSRFSSLSGPPVVHPDYLVGRPGGCDGPCREIHFDFTAYTDPSVSDRLMQFDLSCLTRWVHPCRVEGDIMSSAWAQYEVETKAFHFDQTCSATRLEMLGRDAEDVGIVNVIRKRQQDGYLVATVRLTERLKRTSYWGIRDRSRSFAFSTTAISSVPFSPEYKPVPI